MTREEAIHFAECLKNNWTINFADMEAFCDMAIEALSAEAVQGCDGCRHEEMTPQRHCIRCKRYWRDSYECEGGDSE